jgi:hypothetical protein
MGYINGYSILSYDDYKSGGFAMKIYDDSGFLSRSGDDTLKMFLDQHVKTLLNSAENMSQLEIIEGLLLKRIKDIASSYKKNIG